MRVLKSVFGLNIPIAMLAFTFPRYEWRHWNTVFLSLLSYYWKCFSYRCSGRSFIYRVHFRRNGTMKWIRRETDKNKTKLKEEIFYGRGALPELIFSSSVNNSFKKKDSFGQNLSGRRNIKWQKCVMLNMKFISRANCFIGEGKILGIV